MSWNERFVLRAANKVGFEGSLWILYLAGNTDVGVGKTSDYHTLESSVRAYAQNQGLEDPGIPTIKEGYQNISRKVVMDADGNRDVINDQHKLNIVCLTPLGKGLMMTVDTEEQIKNSLKRELGMDVEEPQNPWWPGYDPEESFAVYLHTYADRSVLQDSESEIEAKAIFDCPRCGEEVENGFTLTLKDGNIVEGWNRFPTVECPNCETEYKHSAADPHREPEVL